MRGSGVCVLLSAAGAFAQSSVEWYGMFEAAFEAAGTPANPYVAISGHAAFTAPEGRTLNAPLFWDGGKTWKVRISPDTHGKWSFRVKSNDAGLHGRSGSFSCVAASRSGSLQVYRKNSNHFQRQVSITAPGGILRADSRPAGLYCHPYDAAERAGRGQPERTSFDDIAAQNINPAYWREVDERLAFANRQGLTVGLALAWGDKRRQEPFAWRFPNTDARKRYARCVAARDAAYDVYFLVSGEWHGEVCRLTEYVTTPPIGSERSCTIVCSKC